MAPSRQTSSGTASVRDEEVEDDESKVGMTAVVDYFRTSNSPVIAFVSVLVVAIVVGRLFKADGTHRPFETWQLKPPSAVEMEPLNVCHCIEVNGVLCGPKGLCNVSAACIRARKGPETGQHVRSCLPDSLAVNVPGMGARDFGGGDRASVALAAHLSTALALKPVHRNTDAIEGIPVGMSVSELSERTPIDRSLSKLVLEAATLCLPSIHRALSTGPLRAEYFDAIATASEHAASSDPTELAPSFLNWVVVHVSQNMTAPRDVTAIHALYRNVLKTQARTMQIKSLVLAPGVVMPPPSGNTTATRDRLLRDGIALSELVVFLRYCYIREYLAQLDRSAARDLSRFGRLTQDLDGADIFVLASVLLVACGGVYFAYQTYSDTTRKRRAKEAVLLKRRERVKSTKAEPIVSSKKRTKAKKQSKLQAPGPADEEAVVTPAACDSVSVAKNTVEATLSKRRAYKRRVETARVSLRQPYHGHEAAHGADETVEDWDEVAQAWVTKSRAQKVADDSRRKDDRESATTLKSVAHCTADEGARLLKPSVTNEKRRMKKSRSESVTAPKNPHGADPVAKDLVKDKGAKPVLAASTPVVVAATAIAAAQAPVSRATEARVRTPTSPNSTPNVPDVTKVAPPCENGAAVVEDTAAPARGKRAKKHVPKADMVGSSRTAGGGAPTTATVPTALLSANVLGGATSGPPVAVHATPRRVGGRVVAASGRRGRGGRNPSGRAGKGRGRGRPATPTGNNTVPFLGEPPHAIAAVPIAPAEPSQEHGGTAQPAVVAAAPDEGMSPPTSQPADSRHAQASVPLHAPPPPHLVETMGSPAAYPHGYHTGHHAVHPQMVRHVYVDPATGMQYTAPQGGGQPMAHMGSPEYHQAQPQEYYVQQDGITYLVGGPPGGYAPPEHYGGQYVTAPGVDPASMAAMHEGNFQTWTGPDGAVYVTAPQYYPQPMHHPQSLH